MKEMRDILCFKDIFSICIWERWETYNVPTLYFQYVYGRDERHTMFQRYIFNMYMGEMRDIQCFKDIFSICIWERWETYNVPTLYFQYVYGRDERLTMFQHYIFNMYMGEMRDIQCFNIIFSICIWERWETYNVSTLYFQYVYGRDERHTMFQHYIFNMYMGEMRDIQCFNIIFSICIWERWETYNVSTLYFQYVYGRDERHTMFQHYIFNMYMGEMRDIQCSNIIFSICIWERWETYNVSTLYFQYVYGRDERLTMFQHYIFNMYMGEMRDILCFKDIFSICIWERWETYNVPTLYFQYVYGRDERLTMFQHYIFNMYMGEMRDLQCFNIIFSICIWERWETYNVPTLYFQYVYGRDERHTMFQHYTFNMYMGEMRDLLTMFQRYIFRFCFENIKIFRFRECFS